MDVSEFSLGKYQIEIEDRYESEHKTWNAHDCIEVKMKNDHGYSAIIFIGAMPERGPAKLCESKDMWDKLKIQWLHMTGESAVSCRRTNNSKYENRDGWYDITASTAPIEKPTSTIVRRIVRNLDGKDTLNFVCRAPKEQPTDKMYKFLEELADTTKFKV